MIAARRSALGRVGGLHRARRLADLAGPVMGATLADARIATAQVDELILGNATESGNPARLLALASSLPERAGAWTIDRQCGSGLDALIQAVRIIALGQSHIILAGGADSVSTAPWRVSRPRSQYHLPRFLPAGAESEDSAAGREAVAFDALDRLAGRLEITRAEQDGWAVAALERAIAARDAGGFVGEIVPLRANAEEARDQSTIDTSVEAFADEEPFSPPNGTATPGNTSAIHDGAAFATIVSEAIWNELGRPSALRLVSSAALGVNPAEDGAAPMAAFRVALERSSGVEPRHVGALELGERSAGQAIAFEREFGISAPRLNADGGAIARGHPLGAAGPVLVTRLFTRMIRKPVGEAPQFGAVALGTLGGIGLAALFERVA
jgi:acetyl-CoA C-acetyltransferase